MNTQWLLANAQNLIRSVGYCCMCPECEMADSRANGLFWLTLNTTVLPLASCSYDTVETERGPQRPRGYAAKDSKSSSQVKDSQVELRQPWLWLRIAGRGNTCIPPKNELSYYSNSAVPRVCSSPFGHTRRTPSHMHLRHHVSDSAHLSTTHQAITARKGLAHQTLTGSSTHTSYRLLPSYLSSTRGSKLKGAHERPA